MEVRTPLTDVITTSPLAMLEEHAKVCAACVSQLAKYFEATQSNNWKRAATIQAKIVELEGQADTLKRDVRRNLPRGLWMSVSRADLLELVRMQDKMANDAKDVAGLSLGRELAFPEALNKQLTRYVNTVIDTVNATVEVVSATRELSRTAFGARQAQMIMNKSAGVEKLERKSDELQAKIRAKLRAHEKKLSPIDAMFLYQLLSSIGEIANSAEKVAHRAQIIAAS